jgi:GH25 family lysozyme M1 (1,4-beta-N-acetylmuramidase)
MNFLSLVEKATGKIPMIYTGYYYWNSYGTKDAGWTHYPFWLAWYATEAYIHTKTGGTGAPLPWTNWSFWQYTDRADGEMFGCESASVDMNFFNGTIADLQSFCKIAPHPAICPTCGQVWP